MNYQIFIREILIGEDYLIKKDSLSLLLKYDFLFIEVMG